MRFFRSFAGVYRKVVMVAISIIVVATILSTTIVIYQMRSLASSSPTIHFAQLPWKVGSTWTFQTGPHNLASSGTNGLDFVSDGDKTVYPVADGYITKIENGGAKCAQPSCADSGTAVWEDIKNPIDGQTYSVRYYHLQYKSIPSSICNPNCSVKANDPLGLEGGTGFSIPAGFPHLWIGLYTKNGQSYSEVPLGTGSGMTCTQIYFGQWQICNDNGYGRLHWTGIPTLNNENDHAYDRYAVHNRDNGGQSSPNGVLNVPTTTTLPQQEAGHVLIANSNGVPIYTLTSAPLTCHQRTSLSSGEHVVVLNNNAMENPDGQFYYWVAYPDSCERKDFSTNTEIKNQTGAVGWIFYNILQETNGVVAMLPSADWRPCWDPSACGDQPYNDSLKSISQWTRPLVSADNNLYAWWDGSQWDPHWFHVLKPETGRHDAAVYGRDWQSVNLSYCPARFSSSIQQSSAYMQNQQEFDSRSDPCPNPQPTPSPGQTPPVTPSTGSTPQSTPSSGSTSTDNSQWISNSQPITVSPGQQFTASFTYKNDGTTIWSDNGYALVCDIYYHGGGNANCMGGAPVGFGGQSVVPGQQFIFTFALTAPSTAGTYDTWWDMTHNGSIFGNDNSYIQVMVVQQQVDNSRWISNSSYVTVIPGQQFTVSFTYENDGTTTWSDGGGYALGCDTYYHQQSNCMGGGPVGFGGQSVAPGQQFTFTFTLTAPSSTGTYTTWWDMAHNGSIFGNNNSYIQVTVAQAVDNSQWVANSSPITVQPGQQFTIYFTYENDGTTTWSDDGGYAIVCDLYYHHNNDCMGGGSVGFNGQSVVQGQRFTFTFTLTAPSLPGTYTTWWDMAHNGSIFGNNNSYVVVNVQ